MAYGLTEKEIAMIKAVFEKTPEAESVFIYGSRAKNTYKKTSDIDLAVVLKSKSENILAKLKLDLDDLPIIYEIDLTDETEMRAGDFKDEYERTRKVFYLRGWREANLSEVINLVGGGTPKTSEFEYWNGNIPWLSVVDFNNDSRWVDKTEKTITRKGLDNSSTKILDKGNLIISARGTVGELAQLKKPMAFNQSCYGIKATENTDIDFLYYLLKWKINSIKKNVHGAVFDTITRSSFNQINILFPSLSEQKTIAKVLSFLDDKIELLRKQNETLEKIAQTIFKQWFVEFEFFDKNNKPYKSSGGKMIKSELGDIPEGWRADVIGNYVDICGGGTPSTKDADFWNGDIHWTSPKDLSGEQNFYLTKTEKKITNKGLSQINSGLLPEGSLLLSSRAPIGYIAISTIKIAINQGYIAFKPDAKLSNQFMILWLKKYMKKVVGSANGSTFLEISKQSFKNIETVIPPESVLSNFVEVVNPNFKKIKNNIFQIQTLSKLRDTLLPKLMSGELRV